MHVNLEVNNVNTKIVGDLDPVILFDLVSSMRYKTNEFNGYKLVEIEHNLFNRLKQSFPTGLYSNAASVLEEHKVTFDVIDKRRVPQSNHPLTLYEVKPYPFQRQIITDAIKNQRFVVQVATGGGKTIIAAAIFAKLNLPSIFVVHTGDLFEQSYDELCRMLQVPIGRIGGGVCDIQHINICMIQTIHSVLETEYIPYDEVEKDLMRDDEIVKKSFIRNQKIKDFLTTVQCVLVDETHHLRATSYVNVMKACKNAFYKGGLSATPHSGDGSDMVLQAYAGSIIGKVSASYLIENDYLVPPTIYFLQASKDPTYKFKRSRYNHIYKAYIVNNKYRNNLIVDCVKRLQELDKTVLITVTMKKHGHILKKLIQQAGYACEFLFSGVDKMKRKEYIDGVRQRTLKIILGTSLADEGLNIPALDSLILAGSGKSPTRMIQRIGRVLRKSPGKTEAIVIDFKDSVRYLLGHYKKRREMCEREERFKIVDDFTK